MSSSDQESFTTNQAHTVALDPRKQRILSLNDAFRRTFAGGMLTVTAGLRELGPDTLHRVLSAVQRFDAFTPDNDPYNEHDFGSLTIDDQLIFWKIDCYDQQLAFGSPDPTDPDVTRRVITVMLASEY